MHVHIANPTKTRLIAESRMKHDALDARMLAELLKSGFLPEAYRAPDDIDRVRMLVRERTFFVQMRTSVKNRMHGILTRRGLHTAKHNPVGKAGAKEIRAGDDPELAGLLRLSEELTAHIEPLDARISKTVRITPHAKLLTTMPSIGDITALTVYAEIGDFSRFSTPNKLAAYAGLVPSQRSSGDRVRTGRITKAGSALLRTTLVEAAFRIRPSKNDDRPYGFYDRVRVNSGAMRARVALARKMLTIMWYMAKHNIPYQPLLSESTRKWDDLARGS
jgi:transposase